MQTLVSLKYKFIYILNSVAFLSDIFFVKSQSVLVYRDKTAQLTIVLIFTNGSEGVNNNKSPSPFSSCTFISEPHCGWSGDVWSMSTGFQSPAIN